MLPFCVSFAPVVGDVPGIKIAITPLWQKKHASQESEV
jgi:hypothetical protein